jgi:hypothetical protein
MPPGEESQELEIRPPVTGRVFFYCPQPPGWSRMRAEGNPMMRKIILIPEGRMGFQGETGFLTTAGRKRNT